MSNFFIDGSRQNGRLFYPSPLLSYSQYTGKNTSQCTSTSVSMNAARGMFPKTYGASPVYVAIRSLAERFWPPQSLQEKTNHRHYFWGIWVYNPLFSQATKTSFYFIIFFLSSLQVEIWKGYRSVFLHRLQDRKLSILSILPITMIVFSSSLAHVYRQKDNIANGLLISVFER